MATTITWRGGSGLWAQPGAWQPTGIPATGQDVLFGAGSYTVTLSSVGAALDAALDSGVTLAITGELDLGGTLTLAAGAALQLDGVVVGGTLDLASGAVSVAGGTLEGVAVPGGFAALPDLTIDAATVADSVAAGGTVAVDDTLALLDGTYDNATLLLDQTAGGTTVLATADGGEVVFGAHAVVDLAQDSTVVTYPLANTIAGLAGAGTFVNDGTILSDVANPAGVPLEIASAGFVNNGLMDISPLQVSESIDNAVLGYQSGPHGQKETIYGPLSWVTGFAPTLDISSGSFDNTGNLYLGGGTLDFTGADVANSGGISLYDVQTQNIDSSGGVESIVTGTLATEIDIGAGVGTFDNTGTLTADSIVLQGSASLAGLGTLNGALTIEGTLDLGGGTLDAGLFNGVTIDGTVADGTILPGGGGLALNGAVLDNVTVAAGSLSVTGPVTLVDPPSGGSVTLDGATTRLDLSGGLTDLAITAGSVAVTDKIALPVGGSETFDSGTTLLADVPGSTVAIGGASSTLVNQGVFTISDATLQVLATLDGSGVIAVGGGGAATLDSLAATAAPTIEFGAGDNLLVLPGTGALGVTIAGLQPGDAIDLVSISSTPSGPFGIGGAAPSGDALDVAGASGETASVNLAAPIAGIQFSVVPDGSGGTLVEAACFAAGTRIATPYGEAPVESLRPGDLVRLADGAVAPVCWVGCTTIDLVRHPDPPRAAPVRIRADAFADGVPARDLLVSPEHCLLIDGALVPAGRLANGATIVRDDTFARIEYWHVELDRHAVLLAENLPAESYLDTGNRALFAGQAGVRALHPDLSGAPEAAALAVWAQRGAAPLRLDAPDSRAWLIARAEALGWQSGRDPGLRVLAGGAALHAVRTAQGVRALLPAGTRAARLCSRSFVPAELTNAYGDTRRLGVAVARALLAGWPLHPDAFAEGWHAMRDQDTLRWTDGDATLALPRLARPTLLEVHLVEIAQYWQPPHRPAAPAAMPVARIARRA